MMAKRTFTEAGHRSEPSSSYTTRVSAGQRSRQKRSFRRPRDWVATNGGRFKQTATSMI